MSSDGVERSAANSDGSEDQERGALVVRLANEGDYEGAIAAATAEMNQQRALHGRGHFATIDCLLLLSAVHEHFGALAWARSVLAEALAEFATDPKPDLNWTISHMKLLARSSELSEKMEDYGAAVESLRSELELQQRFFAMIPGGPSKAQVGDLGCGFNRLGMLYRNLRQTENALAAFETARLHAAEGYGEGDAQTLKFGSNCATQLVALGRFREAVAILDAIPPASLESDEVRINLSGNKLAAHAGAGDLEAAVLDADEAVHLILRSYVQRMVDEKPEPGGGAPWIGDLQWLGVWSALISMAVEKDALPSAKRLAATMLLSRAGLGDEARRLGMRQVHRDGDASLLRESLAAQARIVAELYLASETREDQFLPEGLVASAERRLDELRREVLRLSPAYHRLESSISPEAVTEALPAGAALVAYASYSPKDLASDAVFSDPRIASFVFRSGRPLFVVDLGLISNIAAPRPEDVQGPNHRSILNSGYQVLLAPLAAELEGARELLVIGHDRLNDVPFEALIDSAGRHLIETYSVRRVASAHEILREPRLHTGVTPPLSESAVFSDPDFDAGSGPLREGARGRLSRLAGACREGRDIACILGVPPERRFEGAGATEEAIKGLHDPLVLHLATHGAWGESSANESYFRALGRAMIRAAWAGPGTTTHGELPAPKLPGGVRGWVALRGANRAKQKGDREDGILTGIEAETLDLHDTEIVVLSTCRSGTGAAVPGEGSEGLSTAFYVAGARTRVTSLWAVDDDLIAAMMVAWYQRLARGEDRAEALRQVKLDMLSRNLAPSSKLRDLDAPVDVGWTPDHPAQWAAFVLEGAAGPIV
jgi:CHAT domain-containing protein/tetratricopeptide (TPR) repeat protein